ncbi:alpha-tectorin-like [Sander lucioperca]|uniref:alpha-tectorin-like n=1 Tax=Sander lucioperca TaxID=283035 RepID=UPI00125E4460|nr:alpha-tectorin-like [Sander lucioperca]
MPLSVGSLASSNMLRLLLYLAALCQLTGASSTPATCTVSGPAVIDFSRRVSFIRDRCAYTLMSGPGLQLLAAFKERRRTDVSFLDRVILRLDEPAVDIHLGQGGKVQLNDSTLSLNSSSQTPHGVEISKEVNGVTVRVSLSNFLTSIFFDGTTAQIYVKGPEPASLQGLCVNSSSSLREVMLSEFSSSSCETQSSEAADGRINCTKMTERCNLLKEAPFTSCHSHIDPEPYAAACIDTLCRYPAVDGLSCQFLEAYAGACSLLSNDTLEGWRSKASCCKSGFCQDTFCSAHEFCGEDVGGRPACLCRAQFASKYRPTGALGDPTVCRQNYASVSLAGCLLAEKGINISVLHLNDPACRGHVDERTHMVTFGFNDSKPCGTVVMASDNKITYKNTIKTDNATSAPITRQVFTNIDFSCFYRQPEVKAMSFKMKGGTAMQQIESGSWNYSLSMSMFADAACTTPLDFSGGIQTDQIIYMNLDTGGLDGNIITLVIKACWATSAQNGGGLRYDLIINGCGNPSDRTVKVVENGKGGTVLSFQMFQFKGDASGVFLSCKMKLCLKSDLGCQPNCQQKNRRQRSVRPLYEDENPAIVSVSWS